VGAVKVPIGPPFLDSNSLTRVPGIRRATPMEFADGRSLTSAHAAVFRGKGAPGT
jgi:hypothetical protein